MRKSRIVMAGLIFLNAASVLAEERPDWVTPQMKTEIAKSAEIKMAIERLPELTSANCDSFTEDNVYVHAIDAQTADLQIHIGCDLKQPPPPHALIEITGLVHLVGGKIVLTQVQSKFSKIPCSKLGPRHHSQDASCRKKL